MTAKRHERNAKQEAKICHNFIVCKLVQLKFIKVVRWNLQIIVSKRQKLILS